MFIFVQTNCVDNGPREGLRTFLEAASDDPDTVLHYEFMQDYRVHIKHTGAHTVQMLDICAAAALAVVLPTPSVKPFACAVLHPVEHRSINHYRRWQLRVCTILQPPSGCGGQVSCVERNLCPHSFDPFSMATVAQPRPMPAAICRGTQ